RLGARMIADAAGPDDGDRPADAELQAIGLGSLHPPARDQPELTQPPLEEAPRRLSGLARAAALLLGHRAKEDMAPDPLAADLRQRSAGQDNGVGVRGLGNGTQPFLPAMRAISALTRRSTISGRLRSSHSASIGRSRSRVRPSSEVSPERTICGGALGSAIIASAASDSRIDCAAVSVVRPSSDSSLSTSSPASLSSSTSSSSSALPS